MIEFDLLGVDPGDFGDLVGGGLSPELGHELALGPADLVELLHDVHRYPDRPGLVRQRPRDRLPDPPRRVRGELESLAVVELLRRAHQPERALLDQVQERQPLVAIVLGDRDDQPQVGLHHLLLGIEIAALDPLGQIDLLLSGQQTHLADVLEEQLQRVGRHIRLEIQRRFGFAPAALVRRTLDRQRRRRRRIDVLDELDLRFLQEPVQLLDVGLVQIDLRQRRRDLREREHTHLLAFGQ